MALVVQLTTAAAAHSRVDAAAVAALVQTLPHSLTVTSSVASSSDVTATSKTHAIEVAGIATKQQQLALACFLYWALNCPNAPAADDAASSAPLEPVDVTVRSIEKLHHTRAARPQSHSHSLLPNLPAAQQRRRSVVDCAA